MLKLTLFDLFSPDILIANKNSLSRLSFKDMLDNASFATHKVIQCKMK